MSDDFANHFGAFELLDEDSAMRGFKLVGRATLQHWQRIATDPGFSFERPFDPRLAKAVVKTLTHCFGVEADIRFGFAEHDGFSVLLGTPEENQRNGSRGTLSQLASIAASKMSLLLGDLALFDVRLYQFPSPELTCAYFVWRQQQHRRFALDRWIEHVLSQNGDAERAATIVNELGDDEKLHVLENHEFAFDTLPAWQRFGASIYWRQEDGDPGLTVDVTLPSGDEYIEYVRRFV